MFQNKIENTIQKIDVVLVTYNPDEELLKNCIVSLCLQVRKIWLVDNGSIHTDLEKELKKIFSNIDITAVGENKGIAYAQNVGIKNSLDAGSEYILLTDQDTIYPGNYVEKMLPIFQTYSTPKVAAVAPLFYDSLWQNFEGFVVKSKFGYSKFYPKYGQHSISLAIASGQIIKSNALIKIGLMSEELFIDWVDVEWCWRASSQGFLIIGNADVKIQHHLGDATMIFRNKKITIRSPLRHYYMTRNAVFLAFRSPDLDLWCRLNTIYRSIRYILAFSILVKPRIINFKMTMLGLFHGLIGRLGRLD